MNKEVFKKRLFELMKEKNMKQKDLAKLLNIGEPAMSAYINGKREPSKSTLIEMTKIFDTTLDFLMGLSHSKTKTESLAQQEFLKELISQINSIHELINSYVNQL